MINKHDDFSFTILFLSFNYKHTIIRYTFTLPLSSCVVLLDESNPLLSRFYKCIKIAHLQNIQHKKYNTKDNH